MSPKFIPLLAVSLQILGSHFAAGEVRLLTGDSNNQLHSRAGDLLDISADGDFILFSSMPPTTGSTPGISMGGLYLRRISTNTLTFIGDNTVSNPGTGESEISDNGRYVTWRSANNQIYWRDWQGNVTRHITSGANDESREPKISADGRYVSFLSRARNLISDSSKLPAANRWAVYIYDSQTQATSIGSLAPGGAAITGLGTGANPLNMYDFSANGQYLVYSTDSTNAHPDRSVMTAGFVCLCRRDLSTGAVVMLNRNAAGNVADGNFTAPVINATGNRIGFTGSFVGAFQATRTMIANAPSNPFGNDFYVKDVGSGAVWLASKTNDGTAHEGGFGSTFAISDDGSAVAFSSTSTKIIPNSDPAGGGGGSFDIFRANLAEGGGVTTSITTQSATDAGNVGFRSGPFMPGTGNYIAFCTDQIQQMLGTPSPMGGAYQGVGVGTFPATLNTSLSFETWASTLPAEMRGANDNPSGDGIDNLTKYFTGMNPSVPDRSHLPTFFTQSGTALGLPGDTAQYLTLQVRIRRDLPTGYTWQVCASADLVNLAGGAGAAIQVGMPLANGDFDIYLFRYPTPMTGKGFMSVRFLKP